jgi:hypothetical protein
MAYACNTPDRISGARTMPRCTGMTMAAWLAVAAGCAELPRQAADAMVKMIDPAESVNGRAYLLGRFTGTLMCADCPGIQTELDLHVDMSSGAPTTYTMRETFLTNRNVEKTRSHSGRWTIRRGIAADPDAIVYQLDFERPESVQNFLKVGDRELRALDHDMRELPASLPRRLQMSGARPNDRRAVKT